MYNIKNLALVALSFTAAVSATNSPSNLRQTLLQTANGFLDGLINPGPDATGVIALRTPNCTQRVLPATAGFPVYTNEEYLAYSRRLRTFISNLVLQVPDNRVPVVDETARVVGIPLVSTGDTPTGPSTYNNEYYFLLSMTDDGRSIREITEFLDSVVWTGFLQSVGALEVIGSSN